MGVKKSWMSKYKEIPCIFSHTKTREFLFLFQNSNTGWQRLVLLLVQDGDGARGPGDHRWGQRAGGEELGEMEMVDHHAENGAFHDDRCYVGGRRACPSLLTAALSPRS